MSGGVNGAINKTLTFMVGADEEQFAASKIVLEGMG